MYLPHWFLASRVATEKCKASLISSPSVWPVVYVLGSFPSSWWSEITRRHALVEVHFHPQCWAPSCPFIMETHVFPDFLVFIFSVLSGIPVTWYQCHGVILILYLLIFVCSIFWVLLLVPASSPYTEFLISKDASMFNYSLSIVFHSYSTFDFFSFLISLEIRVFWSFFSLWFFRVVGFGLPFLVAAFIRCQAASCYAGRLSSCRGTAGSEFHLRAVVLSWPYGGDHLRALKNRLARNTLLV